MIGFCVKSNRTVKIISSAPAGRGSPQREEKFSAPRERTPINMAVWGEKVSARKPENTEIKTQQSYRGEKHGAAPSRAKNVIKGRLKVPVERTPIDIAIFSRDLHVNNPIEIQTFQPIRTQDTYDTKEFVQVRNFKRFIHSF